MKVRLLSLNVDKNMPFARFQARVVSSIKSYAEGNETFEHYEKMRDLFVGFQDALENDDLILIAVDKNHYFKLKTAIAQAFEVESVYNPTVLNMLESNESLSDEQRKGFSSFPEPATVFLSKDGMYSGFGFDNGEKFIVLIPIDNDRINIILRNGVAPYLAEGIGGDENGFLSEIQHFDNEKIETAVSRLLESGSVVAVNGTQNAEFIKSCGDMVDHFDEVFVFTPHVEDKGEVNVTEYAAQLARVSLDLSAANIGASISDIYETDEAKYICIAVADEESATVRKLYLEDGEAEEAFVESAALELIELVGEKAAGIRSVGIEVSDAVPQPEEATMEKKSTKKASTIIAIVLGVVILLCAIFAIVYKIQGENGPIAKWLHGDNTTAVSETTTVPVHTTEPVVQTEENLRKISDFIMDDIIALEKKRAEEATKPTETEPATESTTEPITNEAGETITVAEESTTEQETKVKVDLGAPSTIVVNGNKMLAKDAIAGLVMTEMDKNYEVEAIKAQAVVIYTYLKYRDNDFQIDGVKIETAITDEVKIAVDEVFGQYLTYNGEVALTPFFESAAGKTANASYFLSGKYSYLQPVERIDGETGDNSVKIIKLGKGVVQGAILEAGYKIDVDSDPSNWIMLRSSDHDKSFSSSSGYVKTIRVGGVEMNGYEFASQFSKLGINSTCFTVSYESSTETFTFQTYGVGHGVGMSKTGANLLAGKGYSYDRILKTYFSGTSLQEEVK